MWQNLGAWWMSLAAAFCTRWSLFSWGLIVLCSPPVCSCRLELAYFAGKISKNRLVCKNAVALTYYGSCRLLVMCSCHITISRDNNINLGYFSRVSSILVKFAFKNVDFSAEEPLSKVRTKPGPYWPHCWEAMLAPLPRHLGGKEQNPTIQRLCG